MFSGGAHGWNIDIDADSIGGSSVHLLRGIGTVGTGMAGICTLLGPEGPDPRSSGREDETQGLFCLTYMVKGAGTARTLRTTQWTRAS
jgi:hypothetical protein